MPDSTGCSGLLASFLAHIPHTAYFYESENRQEAEAIVADVVERMKRCLRKPADQRLTYGVVTFNSQQQELIQDLRDEALRQQTELEWGSLRTIGLSRRSSRTWKTCKAMSAI